MGVATRAVQTGIGLVAELKAAKKESKPSQTPITETGSAAHRDRLLAEVQQLRIKAQDTESDPIRREQLKAEVEQLRIKRNGSSTTDEESQDEDLFGGDEPPLYAANTVYPDDLDDDESDDSPPPYTDEELANVPSDAKFSTPSTTFQPSRMRHPVIIPQRRPGSKTRGFLRAYAPALAEHDIDQDTFLTFLKSFHKASQASPILTAITIGAGSLGQIPEPGSMLAGIGVTILSGAAENLQQRYRTNAYLDAANENLFKPRGLYCLVMSFRPGAVPEGDVAVEAVDTSKHALKWLSGPTQSSFKTNFRNSSGTTNGEVEMPEPAALIYPDTGSELSKTKTDKEDGKGGAYSKRKVTANYFDKRAQAAYAYKHPDSSLATESTPQFASKYGDPTHPAVTTSDHGRFMSKRNGESLQDRQDREHAKEKEKAAAKSSGGSKSRVKQNIGDMNLQLRAPDIIQNILYLMVVDLPTEEQMAVAMKSVRPDKGRSVMV